MNYNELNRTVIRLEMPFFLYFYFNFLFDANNSVLPLLSSIHLHILDRVTSISCICLIKFVWNVIEFKINLLFPQIIPNHRSQTQTIPTHRL